MEEGGWNTVQGAKNSRVLDPTKFLKITKVYMKEKSAWWGWGGAEGLLAQPEGPPAT